MSNVTSALREKEVGEVYPPTGGLAPAEYRELPPTYLVNECHAKRQERDLHITQNLHLVKMVAKRIYSKLPAHVELDELISAGVVGLVDASSRFDRDKGITFRTFATFRIRGAIVDSLRAADWSSRKLRRKQRLLKAAIGNLTSRNGRLPDEEEIAKELSVEIAAYHGLVNDLNGLEVRSLNDEMHKGTTTEPMICVSAPMTYDPLFLYLHGEWRIRLAEAIDTLPEKERLVVTLYYLEELSMKEISLILGIVSSRVSQLCTSARRKLRLALAVLSVTRH